MKKLLAIGILLSLSATQGVVGQEYKKISKLMDKGYYEQALVMIESSLMKAPNDERLNYYAGVSKLKLYQQEGALEHLLKTSSDIDKKYNFYLANAYFENDLLQKAKSIARKVDQSKLSKKEVNLLQNQFLSYEQLVQSPKEVVVRNMGDKINSKAHEYSGILTSDHRSVVFTVRKSGTDKVASDGLAFEEIYKTTLDDNDEWKMPTPFGNHSAKSQHDATVALFDNDTKMITYHDEDLFMSELVNGKWSKAEPINLINSYDGAETHCFITQAFDTIYYATDVYSDAGDLDLYMIARDKSSEEWSDPIELKELNTPFNDDSPYLAANGDFYFSSQGHNSMGGYDIFKSGYNKVQNKWSKPENLGYNINSASDDTYFNTFGKIAYLSSGRNGGYGNMDIYGVFLFNKVNITGQVINGETNEAIPNTLITVKGKEEYTATSDEKGNYSILVPIEEIFEMQMEYFGQIIYKKKHFTKVRFRDFNDNIVHFKVNVAGLEGEQIETAEEISVMMINDFDTDPLTLSPSNGANKLLTTKVFYKKVDETKEEDITTVAKIEEPLPIIAAGDEPATNETIEISVPELPIVYFDFDKYEVKPIYKTRLYKLAHYMTEEVKVEISITGHTDLVGSEAYNNELSLKRAIAIRNFLVEAGTESNRISISSLGESSPAISKENRERKNRRAEIKFKNEDTLAGK